MLEVILEENQEENEDRRIPRLFEEFIIAFVCISFLLSPLQLMEIKLDRYDEWKFRKCRSTIRRVIQILFVNCVFLGFRLGLSFDYGKDASIFIAKNVIIIFLSLFEICSIFGRCGCDDD